MRALLLSLTACGTQFGPGVLAHGDASVQADAIDAATDTTRYHAAAVEFDTAGNDYMARGPITSTDSASGTYSVWLRFHGADNAAQDLTVATVVGYGGGATRTNTGHLRFVMMNCTGTPVLDVQSQNTYTATTGWFHVLASWDLVGARADIYIDDQTDRAVGGSIVNSNVCYHLASWGIGGMNSGLLDADVAELYLDLGRYTDFSDVSQRRKFRDALGKPVPLGGSCTAPSGNQPTLCFSDGADWPKDEGTGGAFTLNGDGLAAAMTSPSD